MQQHSLLQTKLYIPPIRPELVSRPRLIERMNAALPAKSGLSTTREGFLRALTLVSAPAGFGKSTLVSEWVQTVRDAIPTVAVAWLSLDEGDNDPARFLAYLIAALRTIARGKTKESEPQDDTSEGPKPMLSVAEGPDAGREFTVDDGTTTIGRGAETDLPFLDKLMSRTHCKIVKKGTLVIITDLGSTNGTFVNEAKIETKELKEGDRVRVGGTVLVYAVR